MTRKTVVAAAFLSVVSSARAWAAPNVAVVNVAMVSEKYVKTSELEAQFDVIRKKVNQERDAMKDKIERGNRSLQEELKPGTDEFRNRRKEIALMEAELQWFMETEGQKVERGLAESLRSIYNDIQATAREIAEEKKIDVVLAADQLPPDTPDSPQQVRQHILLQKVLYWSPGVDLTQDVIARLNAKYKPGGTAPLSIDSVQIKPKEPAPAQPPKKP